MRNLLLILGIALMSIANAQLPSYVPSSGLVGWWPFNGNANDESGTGNNGTANGATLTEDRFGNTDQAFDFDGASYIRVVDNGESLDLMGDFTLSCWASAESLTQAGHCLITKDIGNQMNDGSYIFVIADPFNVGSYYLVAQATPNYNNTTVPLIAANPNLNQWYHYASTYEDAIDRLIYYIDGVAIDTVTVSFDILNTSIDMLFGAEYSNTNTFQYHWNGKLDDIGVWQRALTAAEINGLYTGSGVGVTETSMETIDLRVFPNPSNGSFILEHSSSDRFELLVLDIAGRQVHSEVISGTGGRTQHALDLSGLAKGSYSLRVENGGDFITLTLVVE